MNEFDLSRFLRGSLQSIGVIYPIRFVASFALACLVYIFISALHTSYPDVALFSTIESHERVFILSLGSLIGFGRTLLRPIAPTEKISLWLDTIDDVADRGKLSPVQRTMMWQEVSRKLINSMDLDKELNKERMEQIGREAAADQQDRDGSPPQVGA